MMIIAALLALAQGKEVAVAPGGDLAAAVAAAGPGGTVVLEPGRHASGQLGLGPSLTKLTIRSRAGGRASIDFAGKGGIYVQADGAALENLDVLNAQNFGVDIDASDVTLRGCKVLGSGGDAVKLSPGNWRQKKYNRGAKILGCEIGANKAFEGIDCVGQDDVLVADSVFHDTPGWGIYLKGGATRGVVERCVFVRTGTLPNNPAGGVCLGEHTGPDEVMTNKHGQAWESVDCVVRNCLFVDIPSAALAAWCAKNPKFLDNTCVNVATSDRAAFIVLSNHGLPSTDLTFAGNVVVGSTSANRPMVWLYDKGAAGKLVFERNVWWGGNGKFWNQAAGAGPVDFAAWQSAGHDKDGRYADPQLDESFRPKPGGPGAGRGAAPLPLPPGLLKR
jgi:hypothetical protein